MGKPSGVPGQGWYVAAGGAVLGGLALAAVLIAWTVLGGDESTQFAAPGRVSVELRAGSHLIWNDYRTMFDGRSYESPRDFPAGASVRVREAGGTAVPTRRSAGNEFKTRPTDRRSILEFQVAQPGRYEVVVEGSFPSRVLSVAPDRTLRPFIATFGAIAAAMLGLVAGFGLWAWAFFRREAAAQQAAAPAALTVRAEDRPLINLAALVYGLQLAGYFTGISPIAGVAINYAKRDAVAGTWLESHFRWQIRTFWLALAGTALGLALSVVFVGIFILGITAMWFLYRAIRGWMELSEGRPMAGA